MLINSPNRLNISDCDLSVMKSPNWRDRAGYDIVVSYKSIYVNTHTIIVMDSETRLIKCVHESFCLWETRIFSFVNTESRDYISLSKDGMQATMLSESERNRVLFDHSRKRHLLYSLASLDYLKLEPSNCVKFRSQRNGSKEVTVQS